MIAMLLAREVANRHVVEHAPTQRGRLSHHGISCLDDWGLDTAILSDRSLLSRSSLLLSRSGFVQYAKRTESKACDKSARRSFSGAIEGRPSFEYSRAKSGDSTSSASSTIARTGRSGCSIGTRASQLT